MHSMPAYMFTYTLEACPQGIMHIKHDRYQKYLLVPLDLDDHHDKEASAGRRARAHSDKHLQEETRC